MTSTTTDRLNGVTASLAIKAPVAAATTANITLSGTQTIDGVAVVADERVLVKDQTDGVENGIYDVSSGSWTRSVDFNGTRDVVQGTVVYVAGGTVAGGVRYRVTTANDITIGTSTITWVTDATDTVEEADINLSVVSQAEAEAGTATTTRFWTAQRVGQAIAAQEGQVVGVFTPTLYGTTTAGSPTYTNQTGEYVKIGKLCYGAMRLAWSGLGGAAGDMRVGALPFVCDSTTLSRGALNIAYYNSLSLTASNILGGYVVPGQSYAMLQLFSTTTGSVSVTETEATAEGELYANFVYQTT